MKKILLFLVALFVATKAFAYEAQIDGIYYNFDHENKTATVTNDGDSWDDNGAGYTQSEIIIPEKVRYNGVEYSVTRIGSFAFKGCTGLTSIEIPNSVTEIGDYAFSGFTGLTSIEIPNSVTSIGSSAFFGCTGLTSIEIPNSVTSIGIFAFEGCTGLTTVTIGNSVTSIENSAFEGCTGLTSIEIPNSVTEIGGYAFEGCTGLTSIEIPNSVTSIGSSAFEGCTGLTSIEVDNDNQNYASVDGVLYNKNITTVICCPKGKTSIEIPNSVTEIGSDAFEGCTGLTSIVIPNGVTRIGRDAFEGCTGLTSIVIPNGVTWIGGSVFEGCTGLTSIVIPNGVTWIGESAFKYCTGLASIEIPNSVTSIENSAFEGCTGLTSITIGENVTEIGGNSFLGCDNLNIVVWNAIKYSEEESIFGSSVTSITIGENVTSIKSKVFEDCSNLTTVVWNAIKYDNSASGLFKGQITSFTFGNKVEHIPYSLCSGMKELTSIIIPESVTSIGGSVFSGCTGLTSIEVDNDNQNYASVDGVLYNKNITTVICCPKGKTSIEIPNSVTEIGSDAFEGCTGLTSIVIPNSVTEIGDYAFRGCTGLTSITIGENVTEIGSNSFKGCDNLNNVVWNAIKYDNSASGLFKGQITSFTFGDNVEHIPAYLCFGMNGLSSITIPNSVTSIGSFAFEGCTGLTSIVIPNGVTWIGGSVFEGCTGLTSIEIPNSVTSIGSSVFSGCTGLTSIIIGNGVTEIDETIFYNCTGLTSIVIGKGITSIDKNAFNDCSSLALVKWNAKNCNDFSSEEIPFATNPITSFTFGDDVERIPAYLCCNKIDLSSIVIPNLVTEIGESAFEGCGKLRTVEIGKGITSIGNKAFAGCTAIYSMGVDVIIPPIVEASTFENVSRTTQIKVPCGAMVAYQASSYWNEFTNYIESPNTLSVEVNDNTMGMAVVTKQNTCTDITATVQAQARPGYEFVKWSDGFTENPHTVFVMEDMTITAEFAPIGIETFVENLDGSTINIYSNNGVLYVDGLSADYQVFDVNGRLVYTGRDAQLSLPCGVYVVVVGDEVQKVVL